MEDLQGQSNVLILASNVITQNPYLAKEASLVDMSGLISRDQLRSRRRLRQQTIPIAGSCLIDYGPHEPIEFTGRNGTCNNSSEIQCSLAHTNS